MIRVTALIDHLRQALSAAPWVRTDTETKLEGARLQRRRLVFIGDRRADRVALGQRLLIDNRPATFLVRVAGDSVNEKQLHHGNLAVVDRSLVPRAGDVVVVDIDGERSFEVWNLRAGRVELAFANRRYLPFVQV